MLLPLGVSAQQTPQPPPQQQLHIAAAADLQPAMPALVAAYEHATGAHLTVTFGSSATLAQQIENGAPQDVFLSADYGFAEQVIAAGLADAREPTPYARGALVLWARKDSPVQPLTSNTIYNPAIGKIAIANPLHAPYGRAAEAAIGKFGLTEKLKSKLVLAENVAQAAQFADSGNAQLAFIPLTIAISPHFVETGTFVRIEPDAYPAIRQCAVALKKSQNLSLARDFIRWLTTDGVQQNLPKLGLAPAQ